MKLKVGLKNSTELFVSSENDLKIKNVNVYKAEEEFLEIIDF